MRLIDADDLIFYGMTDDISQAQAEDIVANAPTIEAVPVRRGRWVNNDNNTWSCSQCQSWIPDEQHHYARYCLFCGAKMENENE